MVRNSQVLAISGAAVLAFAVSGCARDPVSSRKADPESIRQAIQAQEAEWQADMKAGKTEDVAGQYTDDAVFVASGAVSDGSTQIRKMLADASADRAFSIQFASDKVDVAASGDMAYSRGHFTEKYTDRKSGKVMTDSGTYLSVYRKQNDGQWKMVADFAAADPSTIKEVPPEKPATRAKMVSF